MPEFALLGAMDNKTSPLLQPGFVQTLCTNGEMTEKGFAKRRALATAVTIGHTVGSSAPYNVFRWTDRAGASAAAMGDGAFTMDNGIEDVFRKIDEHGGIAIAAQIERWPTGFLQTIESRRAKMRIYSNEYLTALEITQPQNKGLWNRGQVRGYPKRHACIQGSDAHALDEIGRRPTYLILPSLDLRGLRLAFDEYESRIRFPEEMAAYG